MVHFKYNKLLLALIFVGLMAALAINWQRYVVEVNNNTVEMVMDYEDIIELARTEGESPNKLFQQFKEAGITTLAVYETTLEKLDTNGKLRVLSGVEFIEKYQPAQQGGKTSAAINLHKVYILGKNKAEPDETYEEVKSDLIRRLGAERIRELPDFGYRVMALDANYEKVVKWNLGLSREEMRDTVSQGFLVMARPTNYTRVKPDDVNALFDRFSGIDKVSGLMFVGDEVLGWPDLLPLTVEQMKKRNLTLAMIEHPLQLQFLKQEGLTQLATALNYQAARVYVIPKDEQPKLKIAEAVQRWAVTDQERNIRINLLRKYDKAEGNRTVIETNLDYIKEVKAALAEKGFATGRASWFQAYFPSPWLLALVIIGATAAGVLFLTLLYPFSKKYQYIMLLLISAALILPVLKGGGTLSRQAAALASACIIPVLAMTWQLDRWLKVKGEKASLGKIIVDGAVSLTVTVLFSLIGGFYVSSLLGDVRFFLEMEIYRGVKLTFIMPLIMITLAYLVRYPLLGPALRSVSDFRRFVETLLNYPVQVKTLLAAGAAVVVAWVFIGRSGHTAGVPVPAIELKLRAFFEQVMFARPRSKEFLIGHPAFMIAVFALYRRWPIVLHFVLVIAATIAQGSLVETFAHLRTPVFMSFVRALNGLGVGVAIGTMALIGLQLLQYLSGVLGRRSATHE